MSMTVEHPTKVIFDTNIWISYLIGKRLSGLTEYLIHRRIEIITTPQLRDELLITTSNKKFRKYFKKRKVSELLDLIDIIGNVFEITEYPEICRDPKDNFLLGLIRSSRSNFLVTGDKDLLELNPFEGTEIITPAEFERRVLRSGADR